MNPNPRAGAAAAAALALVLGAPGPVVADRHHVGFPCSIHIEEEIGGRLTLRISDDGRTIKAEARGHFELNDDESDFASLAPGARFRIEERRHGSTEHRIELRGLPDGSIVRTYERDGEKRELDAEGRAWLAEVLQVVMMHTSFGLEQHLEKVLQRSGLDAALAQIEALGSDHLKREAYQIVLDRARTTPDTAGRVVASAAHSIGSDHELAELLLQVAERDASDATLQSCAGATGSIGSDHECSRVLQSLLDRGRIGTDALTGILRGADRIGSDHERAELLLAVADNQHLEGAVAPAYFEALAGVGSDHEHGRVLMAVAQGARLEPDVVRALLGSAASLGSDHEKAGVLEEVARSQSLDGDLRVDFDRALDSIGSSHERERVRDALDERRM